MNLCLMITHLSMLVFGVDSPNKPVNYSGINFVVEENISFKYDYGFVCDVFNRMCIMNTNNIPKDIFEHCAKYLNMNGKSNESSIKKIDNDFYKLSEYPELEPNYLFLNQLLNAMKISISDIFEAVKASLNEWASKMTNICLEKITSLGDNFSSKNIQYSRIQEYMASALIINKLINDFKITNIKGSGKDLIGRITDFLMKYHNPKVHTAIVPDLVDYYYNSYMLFTTILKLDDAISNHPCECIFNNGCCHQKIDISNVKLLINKMSVETFMLLIQFDVIFIDKMGRCISPSNYEFWKAFNLSSVFPPERIINVDASNFLIELDLMIIDSSSRIVYQEDLDNYITLLMRSKALLYY